MNKLKKLLVFIIPYYKSYREFLGSVQNKVSFSKYLKFQLKRDKSIYWPVHNNSEVTHPQNIFVGVNSNPGTRPGCYIQGNGGIFIGNYVRVASNVGIISGNHGLYDHNSHNNKPVYIDDYSWIGMGSIILPGVRLGPRTIVAAGAVVTKSFPDGFCVIGGNPAKLIKNLDKEKFIPTKYRTEFYGFIPKSEFEKLYKDKLQYNSYYNK